MGHLSPLSGALSHCRDGRSVGRSCAPAVTAMLARRHRAIGQSSPAIMAIPPTGQMRLADDGLDRARPGRSRQGEVAIIWRPLSACPPPARVCYVVARRPSTVHRLCARTHASGHSVCPRAASIHVRMRHPVSQLEGTPATATLPKNRAQVPDAGLAPVYGHTRHKAPGLVRSPKLSWRWRSQYYGG